jgi:hypothetical protein
MKPSKKTLNKQAELVELRERLEATKYQAAEAAAERGRFIATAAAEVANGGKPQVRSMVEDNKTQVSADVYQKAAELLAGKIAAAEAELAECEKEDAGARAAELGQEYRESCKVIIKALLAVSREQKKLVVMADEMFGLTNKYRVGGVTLVNEATAIANIHSGLVELYERVPGLFAELGFHPGDW